jgi:hypothetical protein
MADPFGLTTTQAPLLAAVLDEIIPRSGSMPGAGEVGLVADIERAVQQNPAPAPVITQALAVLAEVTRERGYDDFDKLGKADRLALLQELEAREPAFVPTLMFLSYSLYYQHPRVVQALGREARPPHPAGYEMAPNDLTLLDPVRRRGKMFRQA